MSLISRSFSCNDVRAGLLTMKFIISWKGQPYQELYKYISTICSSYRALTGGAPHIYFLPTTSTLQAIDLLRTWPWNTIKLVQTLSFSFWIFELRFWNVNVGPTFKYWNSSAYPGKLLEWNFRTIELKSDISLSPEVMKSRPLLFSEMGHKNTF